jgi:outer membrane protein OmpA-like peptidoglycan-associated protein
MNHFIANGIDKNKLKAFSEGENTPIAKNFSKEGRAKNRRIEIIVN